MSTVYFADFRGPIASTLPPRSQEEVIETLFGDIQVLTTLATMNISASTVDIKRLELYSYYMSQATLMLIRIYQISYGI
jgi:hypothetical protein